MFRTFIAGCLGFIAGAIITYLVVVVGVTVVWDIYNVHDQDGGGAMMLGFVIAPFCGLIGGIVGAFLVPAWAARRWRNAPPQTDDDKLRDTRRVFILGGVILGGFVGHYAAQIGFRFVSPISIDSIWKVWALSWIPTLATLLGALAGGLMIRRWLRSAA